MIISVFPVQESRLRLGEKVPRRCLAPRRFSDLTYIQILPFYHRLILNRINKTWKMPVLISVFMVEGVKSLFCVTCTNQYIFELCEISLACKSLILAKFDLPSNRMYLASLHFDTYLC